MECGLKIFPSSICSLPTKIPHKNPSFLSAATGYRNDRVSLTSPSSSSSSSSSRAVRCAAGNLHKQRSSLESLFCYDKPIPEEIIEKPIGVSLAEKDIGNKPRCPNCEAKGAILCTTCSGSGLYIDSILESQGIMVKVRCLGCGGTGNTMCSECGGRGHI